MGIPAIYLIGGIIAVAVATPIVLTVLFYAVEYLTGTSLADRRKHARAAFSALAYNAALIGGCFAAVVVFTAWPYETMMILVSLAIAAAVVLFCIGLYGIGRDQLASRGNRAQ